MTMLAHTLKNILELVPEATEFVKQASVDKEMPLDSADSTIATALQLKYFEKVAYRSVDVFALDKVAEAVKMYGVSDKVEEFTSSMVKAAKERNIAAQNETSENYFLKVASFEGELSNLDIEDRSSIATDLYKQAKERNTEPSEAVTLYSGNGYLSKEAAVKSLSVRFNETKNKDFVKIARAIVDTPEAVLSGEVLASMADTICKMDKEAGLHFKGYNFYKEAFFTKESAYKGSLTVNLCGKEVPYESIERVGRDKIAQYVGKDIAEEMDSGPQNFKNVVETLPLDLQRVMNNLVQNV